MEDITELINDELSGKIVNKKEIISRLKPFITPETVVLAQVEPIIGDIEQNFNKAKLYIEWANELGAGAIAFPELFLIGCPLFDIIERHPELAQKNIEYLEKLAEYTGKTKVIIGFCEISKFSFGKEYFNSIAILSHKKIEEIIRKTLLPTYSEFDDAKHFQSGEFTPKNRIIEIGKSRVAIVISEENWADKDFFERPLYDFNPVNEIVTKQNPDFIINCTASPTREKKEQLLHNMMSFVSKKYSTPILCVNQVGAFDNITFQGASRCYDCDGKLTARAKSFQEEFFIVEPTNKVLKTGDINCINTLPRGQEKTLPSKKAFSLDYETDLERTYLVVTSSIRSYFTKNGFKKAVLGVSGGLDSSICAVLLADALGASNVFGVSMPSHISSKENIDDAKKLCGNLGLNYTAIPIADMFKASDNTFSKVFKDIEFSWGKRFQAPLTKDNIQARARAMILWGISNEFPSILPIATSDKSELYMGYATINGDMTGGFAPIADITKTKLFALGRWLNQNAKTPNTIPESILLKPPGAELAIDPKTGKALLAEDALMPYEFLDEAIWRFENLHQSNSEMLQEKFLYEQKCPVAKETKILWIEKFFKRMQSALFKWSIMPVSPIIDAHSINKVEYTHPISSKLKFY